MPWLPGRRRLPPVAALYAAAGGGGSFTTLSNTAKNADIALSNGNLTAVTGVDNAWAGVRSVAIFGGGKYHIEITLDQMANSGGLIAGIIRTAATGSFGYPGVDGNSLGFQINNFFYNSGGLYDADNPGVIAATDVLVLEIDDDAGTLDVAINTGSYVRAVYPGSITAGAGDPKQFQVALFTTGNDCTVNFGGSAFVKTPTSGFVGLS